MKQFSLKFTEVKHHFIYLLVIASVAGILLSISAILNLIPFSFSTVCVSNLGNPNLNPKGYYFFTLAFVIVAILLFPAINHIHHSLNPPDKFIRIVNTIWYFLMIIALIGMIGVGVFNETLGAIHYVVAGMAFGGFGLALFLSIPILMNKVKLKHIWPEKTSFSLFFLILFSLFVMVIFELITNGIHNPDDLFIAEWLAFFLILVWIFGLYALSLKNLKKESN